MYRDGSTYTMYTETANPDALGVESMIPTDASGAAIAVAVMLVGAALFLTLLKRSGFRAMVAIGRT